MLIILLENNRDLIRKARKVDLICTANHQNTRIEDRPEDLDRPSLPEGSINVNTDDFFIAESGAASTGVVAREYLGSVKPVR